MIINLKFVILNNIMFNNYNMKNIKNKIITLALKFK